MLPIDDFLEKSRWMQEAEFCKEVPSGVFLCEPDAPVMDATSVPGASPTRYTQTIDTSEAIPDWARGARTPGNEVYYVVPLTKRPRVPYPERILVGRTDQNDIVIPHMSISRSHAYISLGEHCFLVDVGSKHGTFMGDERLLANTPYSLAPGKRLRFGEVLTMFLTATRFFHYCKARTIADHAQRTIDGAIAHKP
jgi:hypothetical protein